jgi:spermidine/putrescine-binding protein
MDEFPVLSPDDWLTSRRMGRREVLRRGVGAGFLLVGLSQLLQACRQGERATPQPTPVATAAGPASSEKVRIPIVNKEMSQDDIVAAMKQEGELVVANWTYTANDQLVAQFQKYVKDTYGVDVKLIYEGTQAPSTYLTNLYTALKAGNPSPYDVMAIEENYWAEAKLQTPPVLEEFLPSPLVPNAERVDEMFRRFPTAIAFQASATPGIVYNKAKVDFLKDWKDLADKRLKGKLTLPLPGDITCGGFLLGLAASLGKDYKNPDQMREVIDFAVDQIGPNVLKYTTDSAEMQQLLRSEAAWAVGFWNSLARLEYLSGYENTVFMIAESGQYLVNGYLWIPKNARHPILAQIFCNWRLSDSAQFPNDWGIEKGPWAELQEGLLGPSYEKDIPDWFKDQYYTYYPKLEQLRSQYKTVDWDYYAQHSKEWFDYYSKRLGL